VCALQKFEKSGFFKRRFPEMDSWKPIFKAFSRSFVKLQGIYVSKI
jgi:hypothetical protein